MGKPKDKDDDSLRRALDLLNQQRQLSENLLVRLDVAITRIESRENTQRRTWREGLRELIRGFRHLSAWTRLFAALTVLVGLVSSLYSLAPRVSLFWGEAIDPDNILSGFVTVGNDGALPIYDVWVNCTFGSIRDQSGGGIQIPGSGQLRQEKNHANRIDPGQRFTALDVCTSPVTEHPLTFDFTVRVTFKPPAPLPYTFKDFRIVSVRNSKTGKTYAVQRER